jgi:hypothetical protein
MRGGGRASFEGQLSGFMKFGLFTLARNKLHLDVPSRSTNSFARQNEHVTELPGTRSPFGGISFQRIL